MTTSAMDPPPQKPTRDPDPEPNKTSNSESKEFSAVSEVSSMNPPPPRNPYTPILESTEVVNPEIIEESKDDSVAVDDNKQPRVRVRSCTLSQSGVDLRATNFSSKT
ncbi:unnamed protein product [Microthlaspi erraticum]|uniref:Uncharacterized protein n=1 Tax=Microthlaspi erraticum TaxID=1685480 RepID=A0A6D2JN76_9BRAS|nr:unnamed protein product [Microthlaspi erraticum]